MLKSIRLALACLLAAAMPAFAVVVPGEPSLTPKSAAVPVLRIAPKAVAAGAKLAPVAEAEMERLRETNRNAPVARKRLAVGIERPVPVAAQGASVERWTAVAEGFAAQASLTSPDAGAVRMAIDLANVPADVEMVFFGSDSPDRLVGPVRVGDVKDRTAPWWSPITDGETQTVEFFARKPVSGSIRISGAAHVFTTVASGFSKRVQDIGDSGSCNVDIKCSALQSSQAFLNARNAVAQMIFNDAATVYLCTGTLVNDTAPATQVPWFYGANHCFDNDSVPLKSASQMQTVANTLNTLWFFEAQSCNARTNPPTVQLTGGAQFIYNNPRADVLFLRLNDSAPAGAFFAAWTSSAAGVGSSVITIHHPEGDLKKVSEGSIIGTSNPPVPGGTTLPFSEVRYTSGTTEGGSSGAGLFTFDGSQYLLRGGLWGGSALCSNPQGTDNFSRFDQVYSALSQYLNSTTGPAFDFTDLWWNPNESGWGLNLIQHPNGIIFAIWYTYDASGKMTWYHVPTGNWTSSTTYTGTLYAVAGPPFSSASFNPSQVKRTAVGTATLSFSSSVAGTWSYSVDGVSGSKSIQRLSF